MSDNFYITTTLPYVNAEPHIGFALEIVQADVIARAKRAEGKEVIFNFGTDEHGLKIYKKALEAGLSPLEYCNQYAVKFDDLKKALNLSYTNFVRTTDPHHVKAAQEFWKICNKNGYIYKKTYKAKYCIGCELEKTDSELADGKCPIHPNLNLELIEEENYFFKFSAFQKKLLNFYESNPEFVIPQSKFNEIKKFVENGLEDFSISRLKTKMPWGIDVPDDPDQVMYVWFDALINYISTLGWPENEQNFKNFWPGVQVAGKDNLRQQTATWQAMLMSAGLPSSRQVFIHGFITIDGQKISKSLGNIVSPFDLINKFGTDAVRYFLLAKIHPTEDSDFTMQKFVDAYNFDLANGLGNLVARVAKLASNCEGEFPNENFSLSQEEFLPIRQDLDEYKFAEAMGAVWRWISQTDVRIEETQPWTLKGEALQIAVKEFVREVRKIATGLIPFLPQTAEKILTQYQGPRITTQSPMFPRMK
jgi:methionyl-tRNA synthetase